MSTDNYEKLRERMIGKLNEFCTSSDGCMHCPINNALAHCIACDWVDMTDQQLTAAMQAAGLNIEADEEARKEKIGRLTGYCDELGKRDIPCEDCIIQYLCMPRAGTRKPFGDFTEDELDEAFELIRQDEAANRKLEEYTAANRKLEEYTAANRKLEEYTAAKPDMVNKPNHYQLPGGLECWDVLVACFGADEVKIWAKINAFTYLFRHKRKNGEEDIRKALVNLQKYFELGGEAE